VTVAFSLAAAVSPIADAATTDRCEPSFASEEHLDRFIELMQDALAHADESARLGEAGIVVRIDVTDVPGTIITLLLDRTPPALILGTAEHWPTVRLWMAAGDLEAFHSEASYLPLKIVSGEVRFEGMVRKLLRIMPVLRNALIETAGGPCRADRRS
jgi:hypothetical protein